MSESDAAFKPHSLNTLLMLGIFQFIVPLMGSRELPFYFDKAVLVLFAFIIIYLLVMTLYAWRIFFHMRRQRLNHDRNFFLAESAGKVRKWAFYISFITYFVLRVSRRAQMSVEDMRYMLRADVYTTIAFYAVAGTALSIIIIEAFRLFSKKVDMWSNRKHILAVLVASLGFTTIQSAFLIRVTGLPVM